LTRRGTAALYQNIVFYRERDAQQADGSPLFLPRRASAASAWARNVVKHLQVRIKLPVARLDISQTRARQIYCGNLSRLHFLPPRLKLGPPELLIFLYYLAHDVVVALAFGECFSKVSSLAGKQVPSCRGRHPRMTLRHTASSLTSGMGTAETWPTYSKMPEISFCRLSSSAAQFKPRQLGQGSYIV
jgi:hypothetical protein